MQKKIAGLVLAVSLFAPLAVAHAAEVMHLPSNNLFAGANSFDEATQTTTSVFVTREKTKGQPRDSIAVIVSGPSGFSFLSGVLPAGALTMNKKKASLDVVIGDIAVIDTTGDLPADGVVSVRLGSGETWSDRAGDVVFERRSRRARVPSSTATAPPHRPRSTGSVLGTALVAPTGRHLDGLTTP